MRFWHRVEAARMTGMTFTNAFTGKPEAPHHTMLLYRFDGVLRAGGLKPTARP